MPANTNIGATEGEFVNIFKPNAGTKIKNPAVKKQKCQYPVFNLMGRLILSNPR
ncbi:hypothetical protein SAMN04487898_105315 [Pedobacter sp. ok626]|uniref:hypothetical protein n=1 Tax=Pedobacter sp. ok626 TaxID=1761882 RepID=UPI00087EA6A0|nr:hypothetical protein [Pedobacter sp. ok626]SDK02612.1 hypothetical protein SAMN04487898_105315 [Pedobacter sp. ok626]